MPARPKQQHYVTRAYLEGFLEFGREFLFSYGRKRHVAFQGRPSELARQRSYYSFRQRDGTWNDSLENEMQRTVETPGLEVIPLLSSGDRRLKWSQRDALAMFVAMQRFRVPHLRQLLDTVHAEIIKKLISEYDQHGPGRMWIRAIRPVERSGEDEPRPAYVDRQSLEDLRSSLEDDPSQFSRESLFDLAAAFARVFRRMKWTVYQSDRDMPFIASDCPALLWHERSDIEHAGISRPDTHVEFPLSRCFLLSMAHDFALIAHISRLRTAREKGRALQNCPEIRVEHADEAQVREFNLRQAQYCSQWAFSGRQNDWLIDVLKEPSRNVRQRIVRDGDLIKVETLTGR